MVTRTQFLAQLTSAGWLLALAGCGGGDDAAPAAAGPNPPPPPPPAAALSCSATQIANNHGHTLSIPAADLNSSVSMSYNIQGAGDHGHQVTFSAAQLAQLKAGQTVTVSSTTTASHSHDVSGACI